MKIHARESLTSTDVLPARTACALVAVHLLMSLFGMAALSAAPASDLLPVTARPAPRHAPISLVENGQPKATICVMQTVNSRPMTAALSELQVCIEEATGVKLPVSKGKLVAGPAIVIGACPEASSAGLVGGKLPIEGFAIKTLRDRVFIVGHDTRTSSGTAWGVFEFLERVIGARWYWPAQNGGRSVPMTASLSVAPMFIEDAPVFRKREIWPTFGGGGPNGELITLHAALRAANSWPIALAVHTPRNWGKLYGKERPEVMQKRKDGSRDDKMLCYGNSRTLETYLEVLSRAFDRGETIHADEMGIVGNAVTVSPWDAGIACYCDDCRKLWDTDAGGLGEASRVVGTFVSRLGKEMKKRWPDNTLIYLPYVNYTLAPEGIEFPDNVEVQLCGMPGVALYKEPATLKLFQGNIDTWRKLTGRRVQTWDYSCWPEDQTKAPYLYPHVLRDYYRSNRDKIIGTFINGTTDHWPRSHLSLYVWLKCLWNPEFDVHAALDEFAKRMFGPAAAPMRDLIKIQCDGWEKSRWPDGTFSAKAVYKDSFPKATIGRMKSLLTSARKQIGNDAKLKQRLDYYERPFEDFCREYEIVVEGKGVRPLVAKRVAETPTIDGKLDEPLWENAPQTTFRRHVKNGQDTEPRHPTWVKAVWTAEGVTFGIRCSERFPNKLRMDNMNRDDGTLWFQDCLEVFLDPSAKGGGKVVQLLITAGGGLFDSLGGDAGWTCEGLKFAKALGTDYWSMEVHVPLTALPGAVSPATGVSWSGQFTRFRTGHGKPDKDSEAQKMNAKYGGFNSNTADFAPIRFVE
ncbi:MAG: DUF4838 domain-containing protein [Planctomycetota bacterium]|nr:DUF4838 domain-containing protein [Planctomycetota bacterium]